MAGPIQSALSNVVGTVSAVATLGKKLNEAERQTNEKKIAQAKAEADYQRSVQKEAKEATLEADLVNMGADPDSARAFMDARRLGLDTKKFKGLSSTAEKLSKNALADSLSSRVINEAGFAERVIALGGNRKSRVQALINASKGGKEDGKE
jgi:hypothetical protein